MNAVKCDEYMVGKSNLFLLWREWERAERQHSLFVFLRLRVYEAMCLISALGFGI